MVTISDKISGAIWGLLTGDALGVPYEFAPPQRIPRADRIEFQPPRDFVRSHSHVPPGTWSDDGAQALCLLSSLLDNKRLDPQDLMERIDLWFHRGLYALDKDVFDIGLQTRQALDHFAKGKPALQCGSTGEWANGNGSLMRALPLALWHQGSDAELVEDSLLQSRVTHAHPRSTMCCALYCLWARGIIAETSDPWMDAAETLEGMFPPGTPERTELDEAIRPREHMEAKGKGYVVDTLWTARQCMDAGDYEAVVRAAISLGNDTDTTACVVGGLAGLRDGVDGIPKRWFKALRGKEMVEPLLIRLLARLEAKKK